jgi:hypothetical protein
MRRKRPLPKNMLVRAGAVRGDVVRRLVITVCLRERGVVVLPVERGGRRRRLDAAGVARSLRDLVTAGGYDAHVSIREGCAGGCARAGPNVDVRIHPIAPPGAKLDAVAIDWKTYVYSLDSLDCLASIIEDNLYRRPRGEELA